MYTDPETGNITTKSIKTIKQQELSQEKELIEAQYSLTSDRLKRADDYKTWVELTQNYIDYLKEYKNQLTDKADKIKIQNKIEDLEVSVEKYKGYGGFKKGKKGKAITIKTPTMGKISFKPISANLPALKAAKAPSLKLAAYKAPKIDLSRITASPLPTIKAPSGNFHLTTYKPGSIVGLG